LVAHLRGTKEKLAILQGSITNLSLYPKTPGDTIYWLKATVLREQASLVSMSTIFAVDFDLMHRRMGHPSNDVLRKAVKHTDNFPREVVFPDLRSNQPICRGCAEGKMHLQPFEDSTSRASRSFELIHSDLKELPVILYHKYKYFVTFLDHYSSYCWVVLMRKKSDTAQAIDNFLSMVRTQHSTLVKEFMTDAGGEYKSLDLRDKFKQMGILNRTSVPHMHQQNGRAERLNRTLIEKAQAMRF
jgi:transposase InsO family protein